MNREQRSPFRNTSLLLIVLTLMAGIALGWLLRDLLGGASEIGPAPATPVPNAPAAVLATAAPEVPAPAPTTAPDRTPTAVPTQTTEPPTLEPAATASPLPAAETIVGYAGHLVALGETLASIAAAGGSTPDLIARYNRLQGDPPAGRALIVPQAAGQARTLASAPLLVERGASDKPWVALTLDAGASADPVPEILKTLREHQVKITFFLTGKWIKENPELTRAIAADGHEIANHTFNHPDMRNLSDAAFRAELADTEAQLGAAVPGASARPFFRPPFGAYDERVLRLAEAAGYLPIYWTLDSLDSVGELKTPEFLLDRVTGKLPRDKLPGAIILAHCGSQPTAAALPQILDRFAEMGIEVKKLSEVLGG